MKIELRIKLNYNILYMYMYVPNDEIILAHTELTLHCIALHC